MYYVLCIVYYVLCMMHWALGMRWPWLLLCRQMLSLSKTHLLVPDFIAQPVNGLLDAYRAFQRCEMPCEVTPMQVGHRAAVFALHACLIWNASHALPFINCVTCLSQMECMTCLFCIQCVTCLSSIQSIRCLSAWWMPGPANQSCCDRKWESALQPDPAILMFKQYLCKFVCYAASQSVCCISSLPCCR